MSPLVWRLLIVSPGARMVVLTADRPCKDLTWITRLVAAPRLSRLVSSARFIRTDPLADKIRSHYTLSQNQWRKIRLTLSYPFFRHLTLPSYVRFHFRLPVSYFFVVFFPFLSLLCYVRIHLFVYLYYFSFSSVLSSCSFFLFLLFVLFLLFLYLFLFFVIFLEHARILVRVLLFVLVFIFVLIRVLLAVLVIRVLSCSFPSSFSSFHCCFCY